MKIHIVENFIAGLGRTRCGIYTDNLTAFYSQATCKNCLRIRIGKRY